MILEIICFHKRLRLNHLPYAIRGQKNRDKVKREMQQRMYCINERSNLICF